jgi:hypothetical protein
MNHIVRLIQLALGALIALSDRVAALTGENAALRDENQALREQALMQQPATDAPTFDITALDAAAHDLTAWLQDNGYQVDDGSAQDGLTFEPVAQSQETSGAPVAPGGESHETAGQTPPDAPFPRA